MGTIGDRVILKDIETMKLISEWSHGEITFGEGAYLLQGVEGVITGQNHDSYHIYWYTTNEEGRMSTNWTKDFVIVL